MASKGTKGALQPNFMLSRVCVQIGIQTENELSAAEDSKTTYSARQHIRTVQLAGNILFHTSEQPDCS